jgi:hypothetical protein
MMVVKRKRWGTAMRGRIKTVIRRTGIALIATSVGLAMAGDDTLWDVKVIRPNGRVLDVKAVDSDGKLYDVKAIEGEDNPYFLDVKAFVDGKPYPVKVVDSSERYAPVMAIDIHGKNLEIRALGPEGKHYDVKGIRQMGSIIRLRAIGVARNYPISAIAPDGRIFDVKGVKMVAQRVEMVIGSTQIHAHVKALPPTPPSSDENEPGTQGLEGS